MNKFISLEDYKGSTIEKAFQDNKEVNPQILLDKINKAFETKMLNENEAEKAATCLDNLIQKAKSHKYIKREGAPGSYKYIYKEGEKKSKYDSISTKELKHENSGKQREPGVNLHELVDDKNLDSLVSEAGKHLASGGSENDNEVKKLKEVWSKKGYKEEKLKEALLASKQGWKEELSAQNAYENSKEYKSSEGDKIEENIDNTHEKEREKANQGVGVKKYNKGDIIQMKNDNDIPQSLADLKGQNLKILRETTVNFASGAQLYFVVLDEDGEERELPEHFIKQKVSISKSEAFDILLGADDTIEKGRGPGKNNKYLRIENGKYIYDEKQMSAEDHKKAASFHKKNYEKYKDEDAKNYNDDHADEREFAEYHEKLAKEKEGKGGDGEINIEKEEEENRDYVTQIVEDYSQIRDEGYSKREAKKSAYEMAKDHFKDEKRFKRFKEWFEDGEGFDSLE